MVPNCNQAGLSEARHRPKPRFSNELDVFNSFIKVIGQNQTNARSAVGIFGTKIDEPPVVSPYTCEIKLVFFMGWRMCCDHAFCVEGGDGVREHNFADHPLRVLVGSTDI